MKKIIFFLLISIFTASVFSFTILKEKTICTVKYNGIYACKLDEEHSAVIRFYQDETVLASTSVNDYMDVFSWFHKENKDMVLTGKYKIKKCNIKFNVSGMTGEQKYTGQINENSIQITLEDVKTKKTVTRAYTFFAL